MGRSIQAIFPIPETCAMDEAPARPARPRPAPTEKRPARDRRRGHRPAGHRPSTTTSSCSAAIRCSAPRSWSARRDAFGVDLTLFHLFEGPHRRQPRCRDRGSGDREARFDERRRDQPDGGRLMASQPRVGIRRSACIACSIRRCWPIPIRSMRGCARRIPVHWDPFLHCWVVTRLCRCPPPCCHGFSADRTPSPEQLRRARSALAHIEPIAAVMVKQIAVPRCPRPYKAGASLCSEPAFTAAPRRAARGRRSSAHCRWR